MVKRRVVGVLIGALAGWMLGQNINSALICALLGAYLVGRYADPKSSRVFNKLFSQKDEDSSPKNSEN